MVTGLGLAVSAGFGGLEDAPAATAPVIESGSTHVGSELSVSVSRALLIDAFPEQYLVPEEGNRLLVVRAVVENTTTEPRRLTSAPRILSSIEADSLRVSGIPGQPLAAPPTSILTIDDGSDKVVVQPGVPVELAFIWEIAEDAVAAGDTVEVQLLDRVLISEGRLTYGGVYGDPVVSATLELQLDDVGAGVSE